MKHIILIQKQIPKLLGQTLIVCKKSIEENEKIDGIIKVAKISSARKELKQYINQFKIIAYAVKDLVQNVKLELFYDLHPIEVNKR